MGKKLTTIALAGTISVTSAQPAISENQESALINQAKQIEIQATRDYTKEALEQLLLKAEEYGVDCGDVSKNYRIKMCEQKVKIASGKTEEEIRADIQNNLDEFFGRNRD